MTKYTDDFEQFWAAWPGRYNPDTQLHEKRGKHEAFIVWGTVPEPDRQVILKLVKSGRVKAGGTRFLLDAWKWLAKKRWEDYA